MNDYVKKVNDLINDKELKTLLTKEYTGENDNFIVPVGICENEPIYMNLETVHGLFVGGTTGSGKSIFLDTIIISLMLKNSPEKVKFLFLDPKKIELGEYDGIKYLNTENKKNISESTKGLDKLLDIMHLIKKRLGILLKDVDSSINSYNSAKSEKWPHIFIVIDEASDIMQIDKAQKVVEDIMNYGKCVGIHVILATNTYLKNMYETNFLKKFKYRISFDMATREQAKYIEIEGCNLLKGGGNGIIKCTDDKLYNFQAPFISDDSINKVVNSNK